jgi:uncharacterized protein
MKLLSPRVEVRDTQSAKGRGVFTLEAVREGDVVEICPVVILEMPFESLPEEFKKLAFDWDELADRPGTHALALGYGSLYNDDNPANMRYEAVGCAALRFSAVRAIRPGDELTINYSALGGGAVWHNDDWFDRMNVTLVRSER